MEQQGRSYSEAGTEQLRGIPEPVTLASWEAKLLEDSHSAVWKKTYEALGCPGFLAE